MLHRREYDCLLEDILIKAKRIIDDAWSDSNCVCAISDEQKVLFEPELKQFYYKEYKLIIKDVRSMITNQHFHYSVYLKYDPDELLELCRVIEDSDDKS